MNFFSPIYFDTVRMRANNLLISLASVLVLKKDEFRACCENQKAQEADDILTENITSLMHIDNIQLALEKLISKFPELNINLSNVVSIKDKVVVIGEYADKMLKIAESREVKSSTVTLATIESIGYYIKNWIKEISYFLSHIKERLKGKYRRKRNRKLPDITREDERAIRIIQALSKIYNNPPVM